MDTATLAYPIYDTQLDLSNSNIINEETDKSNSLHSNQDKELFKNAKLNRRSAHLLRRR